MAASEKRIRGEGVLHRHIDGTDWSKSDLLVQQWPNLDESCLHRVNGCYLGLRTKHENATPLLASIITGELEMCRYLIEDGADVNLGCLDGMGPLCVALNSKQYKIAELLIEFGANIHTQDQNGMAPMHYAISKDSPVSIVKAILSAELSKGDIILDNVMTKIPLLYRAISVSNVPVVEFLLEQNVDVNTKYLDITTPLSGAVLFKSPEIVKLLINRGAKLESLSINCPPPLYNAVQNDDTTILKILIEAGVDVNKPYTPGNESMKYGPTAIEVAAMRCKLAATKFLFKHGATVNTKNGTIFHMLFNIKPQDLNGKERKNHQKIIRFFLENGVDVNVRDTEGKLPVCNIFLSKNWIALEEYIKFGGTLNEPICKGGSIFQLVLFNKLVHLVELCLAYGADCSQKILGEPIYNDAVRSGSPDIMRLFWKYNYPFDKIPSDKLLKKTPKVFAVFKAQILFMEGVVKNDPEIVKKALQQGASVNCVSRGDVYPLHISSVKGDSEVMKIILDNGAQVSTLDYTGLSALHKAAGHGHLEVCKLLLRHGACLDYRGSHGLTPRQVAKLDGHTKVVTLLQRASTFFTLLKNKDLQVVDEIEKNLGSEEFYVYMNSINHRGNTLLGEALRLGLKEIGEKLMSLRLRAV